MSQVDQVHGGHVRGVQCQRVAVSVDGDLCGVPSAVLHIGTAVQCEVGTQLRIDLVGAVVHDLLQIGVRVHCYTHHGHGLTEHVVPCGVLSGKTSDDLVGVGRDISVRVDRLVCCDVDIIDHVAVDHRCILRVCLYDASDYSSDIAVCDDIGVSELAGGDRIGHICLVILNVSDDTSDLVTVDVGRAGCDGDGLDRGMCIGSTCDRTFFHCSLHVSDDTSYEVVTYDGTVLHIHIGDLGLEVGLTYDSSDLGSSEHVDVHQGEVGYDGVLDDTEQSHLVVTCTDGHVHDAESLSVERSVERVRFVGGVRTVLSDGRPLLVVRVYVLIKDHVWDVGHIGVDHLCDVPESLRGADVSVIDQEL